MVQMSIPDTTFFPRENELSSGLSLTWAVYLALQLHAWNPRVHVSSGVLAGSRRSRAELIHGLMHLEPQPPSQRAILGVR